MGIIIKKVNLNHFKNLKKLKNLKKFKKRDNNL
jgi:hypothetical protein